MSRSSKVTPAGNPIKFWRLRGGRGVIAITQMETSHIQNCIRMIEEHRGLDQKPWREEYLPRLKLELAYRRARALTVTPR